jgi:hypothetical protein
MLKESIFLIGYLELKRMYKLEIHQNIQILVYTLV